MKQGTFETLIGFLVIIIAFVFFIFAYTTSGYSNHVSGYNLIADFQNIDGISKGSDVKMAGIKIGVVEDIALEEESYYAILKLKIRNDIQIPEDSNAIISTSGLVGNKFVKINPGSSDDNFKNGGKIRFTQSTMNIEDLVSKLVYSMTSK